MVTTRSRSAAVAASQAVPEQRKAIAQPSQPATKGSDNPFDAKDVPETPDLDEHSETVIESGDDQVSSKSVSDAYDALSEHDVSDVFSSEIGDDENGEYDEDIEDGEDVEADHDGDIERVKAALAVPKTDKHTWEDFPGEVKVSLPSSLSPESGRTIASSRSTTCHKRRSTLLSACHTEVLFQNKIYRYLMKSHKPLNFEHAELKDIKNLPKEFCLSGQMLQCSKQVCAECQPILYGENIIQVFQNLKDFTGTATSRRRQLIRRICISTKMAPRIINKARKAEIKSLKNLLEIVVDGGVCPARLTGKSEDVQEDLVRATFEETDYRDLKSLLTEHVDIQQTYLMTGQTYVATGVSNTPPSLKAYQFMQPDDPSQYTEFRWDIISTGGENLELSLAGRKVYTTDKKTGYRCYIG
jgi:hypothetical protein